MDSQNVLLGKIELAYTGLTECRNLAYQAAIELQSTKDELESKEIHVIALGYPDGTQKNADTRSAYVDSQTIAEREAVKSAKSEYDAGELALNHARDLVNHMRLMVDVMAIPASAAQTSGAYA